MASWTFRNLALSFAAFVLAGSTALAANPPATTNKPKPKPQLKAISPSQAKTDTVRRTLPVGVDPGAMDNAGGPSQSVMDDLSDAPPSPPNLPPAQPWTDAPKQQPQWQTNVPTQNAMPTKPSTAFPSEDMIPDFNKPFPSAANQAMQQPAHPPQPVYPQFQQLPPEQPAYPQYQQVTPPVYPQFTQPQQPMQAGQQPMYPQFQQQMPMQPPAYPQYQQPYPQYAQQVPMQQMPMQQFPTQQGYPQFQQQMPMQTVYPQFQQQAPTQPVYQQYQQQSAQPVYPQFQQQAPAQPVYPQFQQQAPTQQGYPQFPPQFPKPATQSALPAKKPTTAAVKKPVSDSERVSRMEKIAFGKTYPQEEVADRVDRLEIKVFGKPKDGAVHQRISGLEKALKVGY